MEAYVYDAKGQCWQLPVLLRWEFSHGFCAPCDCFAVEMPFSQELVAILKTACRFRAAENGETVFFGVVDEAEFEATATGCIAALRGRGMQALLLDSEAERADYYAADMAFLLAKHAAPLGISAVDATGAQGRRAALSVSSGESHWSVLRRFAEFCLGLRPRFRPDGVLVVDGAESGKVLRVGGDTAVCAQRFGLDRYGVITDAIVKNRVYGTRTQVRNEEMLALGGKCVRVINVPRYTALDAMRHTGAYQIEKSSADMLRCRLTLAEPFAAFPGDRVLMETSPLGINGAFSVESSRSFADGKSAGTVLDMRPAKDAAKEG